MHFFPLHLKYILIGQLKEHNIMTPCGFKLIKQCLHFALFGTKIARKMIHSQHTFENKADKKMNARHQDALLFLSHCKEFVSALMFPLKTKNNKPFFLFSCKNSLSLCKTCLARVLTLFGFYFILFLLFCLFSTLNSKWIFAKF